MLRTLPANPPFLLAGRVRVPIPFGGILTPQWTRRELNHGGTRGARGKMAQCSPCSPWFNCRVRVPIRFGGSLTPQGAISIWRGGGGGGQPAHCSPATLPTAHCSLPTVHHRPLPTAT